MLQRSVYSIVNMKSTLASAPEMHQRALAYVSDELLQHVPESTAPFSLFDGFQASLPEEEERQKHNRRHRKTWNARGQKLVGDAEGAADTPENAEPSLDLLKQDRQYLDRRLDMMAIRKSMCSAEIREIDTKLANLAAMRKAVLERLAGLESEESEMEHELLDVDAKIDELSEKLQTSAAASQHSPTTVNSDDPKAGLVTPPSEKMSESIYASPSSPQRRGRRMSRRSMPILHEHMESGALIRELPAHTDSITALDFDAPFGTLVTASMDDTVRVWDMHAGRCLGFLEGHLSSARAVQVEDNLVATGAMDASVRLWDLSRAEYISQPSQTIGGSTAEDDDEEDDAGVTTAVSLQNCPLYTLSGHVDSVTALNFHGDTLVSGGADRTLRQWDLETGRCVQTLDVLWAAAQSNATVGSTGSSGAASTGTWRGAGVRAPAADSPADFVGALQVYGAALAVGFSDSMIRLFDLRSGKVHRSLVGHTDAVTALHFDDLHLVTASQDRSVRVSTFPCFQSPVMMTAMLITPARSGTSAPPTSSTPTPTATPSPACTSTVAASSPPPAKTSPRSSTSPSRASGIAAPASWPRPTKALRRRPLSSACASATASWSRAVTTVWSACGRAEKWAANPLVL
jgi:mitochondrial division protein 1